MVIQSNLIHDDLRAFDTSQLKQEAPQNATRVTFFDGECHTE